LLENKNIQVLYLRGNNITKDGINYLKESLKKNQFLKEINFYGKSCLKIKLGNEIKDEGCKVLNEILLENKKLEKIDLSGKFSSKIKTTL
jgi:Ran GTPase-activating protein (RanGAP) involved in mRNA processing and transport